MSEYDDVERLMRLKRHEQPPEDFVEDFMRSFHQRQRVELMNQSARGLVLERFKGIFETFFTPKYAFASVGACLVLGVTAYSLMPTSSESIVANSLESKVKEGDVSYAEYREARAQMIQNPLYLGSHYKGGFGDTQEAHAASTSRDQIPNFRSTQPAQGTALPANYTPKGYGFKLDLD